MSKYKTSAAFKAALEHSLKAKSKASGRPYIVLRKLAAFDRFVARIFADGDETFALKGGYSMEIRLGGSRTTKDIDLVLCNPAVLTADGPLHSESIRKLLQEKLESDLCDFFTFRLGKLTVLDVPVLGGFRISAKALLGGSHYEEFHLDLVLSETDPYPLETLNGDNLFSFADIPASAPVAISKELQFAEKLHAYSIVRGDRQNTRVKDLIDMIMLIRIGLDPVLTRTMIISVFRARNKQAVPTDLAPPPESWRLPFAAMSAEMNYSGQLSDAYEELSNFFVQMMAIA